MAPLKVIIVGGGLSGACLTNGLLNHGHGRIDVAVYERDTVEHERGGYQIRLGAHALTGFRACLTPQQYQQLLTCFGRSGGVVSSAPALYTVNMELLIDLGKFPVYTKSAPVGRGRLRKFLQGPLDAAGVMHYGKQFVRYEILPADTAAAADRVRVHFKDGTSEDCDILVSAEGSGSRANKQIGLDNICSDSPALGAGSLLGKCSLPRDVLRTLPKPLLEKGTMACGNDRALLFTAAYLPDNLKNVAGAAAGDAATKTSGDQEEEEEDYDEEQASLMVAVGWTTGPSSVEAAKLPDPKKFMREKMREAGFHEGYLSLVDALDPQAIQGVPWRFARDTTVDWREQLVKKKKKGSRGNGNGVDVDKDIANPRVWLMGDSIHPMLPSRGMGANNAIHDTADALGPLLELARRKEGKGVVREEEVVEQLRIYEKAMIPRAFKWVKTSNQQALPDMESFRGKCIIVGMRIVLTVLSGVVGCAKFFGWKPKDDAPELP